METIVIHIMKIHANVSSNTSLSISKYDQKKFSFFVKWQFFYSSHRSVPHLKYTFKEEKEYENSQPYLGVWKYIHLIFLVVVQK